MEDKIKFKLLSKKLVSLVDFIKWTSSFSRGTIHQMETPISGIRLDPTMLSLFALAKDEIGWMFVMHEDEAPWLENLPLSMAFIGFSDGIILVTDSITLFDQPFEPFGIDVLIPQPFLRDELRSQNLLGFGLKRKETNQVERINRVVPLYNPESYELLRTAAISQQTRGLFSQQR